MSKPWDDEPTPWTDAADDDIEPYMPIDRARLMEQRMRAAERLLRETAKYVMHIPLWKDAMNHLDAASNEDAQ